MGNLFSALGAVGNALSEFQRAVNVTQNNVTNANSPGYARQAAVLQSLPFQLENGLTGGVHELTQSTRNEFAEAAVQQQLSLLGEFKQLQSSLAPLQTVFDVSGNSAIPSALNKLFQSFSAWSAQPDSAANRSAVLSAAGQVAAAFQQAAAQLSGIRSSTDRDLQSTLAQINQDAAKIRDYNVAIARQGGADAGLDAQLHSTLEDLSNLAGVQVISGNNGTVTVLLGGQTPLVIGDQLNTLSVNFSTDASSTANAPPVAAIVDSHGADITSQVSSGSLQGLLSVRNGVLPSLIGGGAQQGDLNVLAKGLADAVNSLLASGSTTATPPPQAGKPLFTYDSGSPTGIAASLALNSSLAPGDLAAVDPGPPLVSNGTALKLAALDSAAGGQINGLSFTGFFSSLVSRVGTAAQNADTGAAAQEQLVTQAKSLRQDLSGVSLDEEAVHLVELQRSYQAASKVVSVIDDMTQSILDMVR